MLLAHPDRQLSEKARLLVAIDIGHRPPSLTPDESPAGGCDDPGSDIVL